MRTAKSIQLAIYENYLAERERREAELVKKHFWPSDFLKPLNELWWAWMNEPKTNPPSPEKLAMFDVGKLCELHVMRELVKVGVAADTNNEDHMAMVEKAVGQSLSYSSRLDEFGKKQIRVEMEREYVPVKGFMDGITLSGEPIECKSTRSAKYIKDVATGKPPQVEHVGQLAIYMDYIGAEVGWLCVYSRPDGTMMFVKVEHLGNRVYATTDHSLGLPEEMLDEDDDSPPVKFEVESITIDLDQEYKRWRSLFEEYIHTRKEPPLQFQYRPAVTKELLDSYVTDGGDDKRIRAAIKGKRILSEHGWKPQYCDWRDLWIQRECEQKGFKDKNEMLTYTKEEIQFMLDYLDAELIDGSIRKITENRRKQLEQMERDKKRKHDPSVITDQRRRNGVEDGDPISAYTTEKQAKMLFDALGIELVKDLDSTTDEELLSVKGIGAGLVEKLRASTFTFDLPEWK